MIGRAEGRQAVRRTGDGGAVALHLGVPDRRMSQVHARMVRELDRRFVEDAGSKNGVVVNGIRLESAALADGDVLELGQTLFLFRAAGHSAVVDSYPVDCDASALAQPAPGLITFVPSLSRAFDELAPVARTSAPILVPAETGTGKELVARAVHALARARRPFVAVNCGALPGRWSRASCSATARRLLGRDQDRPGLLRSADRGTLFLDEIGDCPPAAQTALLRGCRSTR